MADVIFLSFKLLWRGSEMTFEALNVNSGLTIDDLIAYVRGLDTSGGAK